VAVGKDGLCRVVVTYTILLLTWQSTLISHSKAILKRFNAYLVYWYRLTELNLLQGFKLRLSGADIIINRLVFINQATK